MPTCCVCDRGQQIDAQYLPSPSSCDGHQLQNTRFNIAHLLMVMTVAQFLSASVGICKPYPTSKLISRELIPSSNWQI